MGRDENVAVFQDTERQCKDNEKLVEVIKNSNKNQMLIIENEKIEVPEAMYEEPAEIIVSKKRTFEAAAGYKGEKVCVLNFASAGNPGGGVENGANAQEEALCRCSTLYFNLIEQKMWEGFYKPHRAERNPLHNDDIIYTPDVCVFKSDTASPKLLPETDWYSVNVITCAAPNLREMPGNRFNSGDGTQQVKISDTDLLKLQEKRLRKIMSMAAVNGNDVVILGAFGCGVFRNPPRIVAQAAKNVLREFEGHFKTIEFAVYCSPTDDSNYMAFRKVLEVKKGDL